MNSILKRELMDTWRYRGVVENFVKTSLLTKYKRSFLGYIWTILAPFMRNLVIGYVFSRISGSRGPDFFLYFFAGAVFFDFIRGSVISSTLSFISNEHYIKKIYIPKLIFILNVISYEFVNFLFVFFAVLLLGFGVGMVHFSLAFLFLPLALLITFLFLIGLGCILSVVTVYFRDLTHISDISMQLLYFLTPILTKPEALNPWLVKLNPIYYFVELFRVPIVNSTFPDLELIGLCTLAALLSLSVGLLTLGRFANRIVFKL